MSINIRCPVCSRYVSVVGRDKVARHNNYDTVAPGTRWSYLVCKGSGADASELVVVAKRAAEVRQTERDLAAAESRLRYAQADVDKATAWATECDASVTALRAKLAAMQAPEADDAPVQMSPIATVEVKS